MNGYERIAGFLEGRQADGLPWMPIITTFAAAQIGAPYGKYVTDHRVLAEAQLVTAERFDLDHVSVISDPVREAADCGAAVLDFADRSPGFDEAQALLIEKTRLKTLKQPDPRGGGRMHDRVKAIEIFRQRVGGEKYIEGWIEGPCAEGANLRGVNRLLADFADDPQFVRDLFEFVVEMEIAFAKAQIEAGADCIGMGDAAAARVSTQVYDEFVFPYEQRLVNAIHGMGSKVRLHICGDARRILSGMGKLGCDMIDVDFLVPLSAARAAMGEKQVLTGNLDPVKAVRDATPATIGAALAECWRQAGPRWIVAAGCETLADTAAENLRAMHDFARAARG